VRISASNAAVRLRIGSAPGVWRFSGAASAWGTGCIVRLEGLIGGIGRFRGCSCSVGWRGEGRLQRVNLSEFNYSTGSSLIII
jgi:hypothetical protein